MNKKFKKIFFGDMHWKRLVRSVVFVVVMTYLGLVLLGCFCADSMMFPVPKASYVDNDKVLKIKFRDGKKISARMQKVEDPEYYILYSHGNAVDLGRVDSFLAFLSKTVDCNVISYDYPGYGTSEGTPSEDSVLAASEATYNYLKSQGVSDSQIIIWGRSVGSGPAVHLAYKFPVAALILESPFKSAFTVVTRIPILPFDRFKNINVIDQVNCPVLIIHGTEDRVIPFYHGEALFSKAIEPKYKYWIEGAGHNNVSYIAGDKYWDTIKDFIDKKIPDNK